MGLLLSNTLPGKRSIGLTLINRINRKNLDQLEDQVNRWLKDNPEVMVLRDSDAAATFQWPDLAGPPPTVGMVANKTET